VSVSPGFPSRLRILPPKPSAQLPEPHQDFSFLKGS